MFSGLTNQFTSLVGAVKGQGDEDVPVPNQDAAPAASDATVAAAAPVSVAAAEAGAAGEQLGEGGEEAGKSGWLGSAKGWLGSASIPSMPAMPSMPSMPAMPAMPSMPSIPGLRKNAGGEGEADGVVAEGADLAGGAVSAGEDEDKSRYISATEGADSHPASGGGTPTGDEGQIGQVTTKVTQQAKHFGSFLSSAISKAGSKIKETTHIPQTLLESFNKEQEAFMKGQGGVDSGMAPWIGHSNEAKIKEEILGLSQDRRNFVRAPPAGVDFEFNYDTAYPTAVAIMAEDKALETMRFELVPKIITEENFWRNYFYRVSLIIQAAELGTLGADGVGQASSGEDERNNKKSKVQEIITNDAVMKENENTKNDIEKVVDVVVIEKEPKKVERVSESEFVSDAFKTKTPADMEMAEIKDGMRRLGIDSLTQKALDTNDVEEQWEKDLEAELRDYEVVCSSSDKKDDAVEDEDNIPTISNIRTRTNNSEWEEEYADLIEDTDDLKTLKSLKRVMLGYQKAEGFFTLF